MKFSLLACTSALVVSTAAAAFVVQQPTGTTRSFVTSSTRVGAAAPSKEDLEKTMKVIAEFTGGSVGGGSPTAEPEKPKKEKKEAAEKEADE